MKRTETESYIIKGFGTFVLKRTSCGRLTCTISKRWKLEQKAPWWEGRKTPQILTRQVCRDPIVAVQSRGLCPIWITRLFYSINYLIGIFSTGTLTFALSSTTIYLRHDPIDLLDLFTAIHPSLIIGDYMKSTVFEGAELQLWISRPNISAPIRSF